MSCSGESTSNIGKIIQGQAPGELSSRGQRQAQALCTYLRTQTYDTIYCSDLNRAMQTLAPLLEDNASLPTVIYDARLREKACGIFEGQPIGSQERAAKLEGTDLRAFRGQGAESWEDVMQRAALFLQDIQQAHDRGDGETSRILVVAHGGFIKECLNAATKRKTNFFPNNLCNCSITKLKFRQGRCTLTEKNNVSHLKAMSEQL